MKMTKAIFADFEKKYTKLSADNGRLVAFFDNDEMVASWMDATTFKFASPADYEKFNLEAICDQYTDKLFAEKTAGMSLSEKIAVVESSYSEDEKRTIASLKNRMAF